MQQHPFLNENKAVKSVSSVLICDNDLFVRTSIINKLHELGMYEIIECSDSTSAAALARECLPDLAVLDTAILQNGGLNAAREIRQKLKIPVILTMSLKNR
jgi:two-component system, response regulator PdtaR